MKNFIFILVLTSIQANAASSVAHESPTLNVVCKIDGVVTNFKKTAFGKIKPANTFHECLMWEDNHCGLTDFPVSESAPTQVKKYTRALPLNNRFDLEFNVSYANPNSAQIEIHLGTNYVDSFALDKGKTATNTVELAQPIIERENTEYMTLMDEVTYECFISN